MGQAVTEADLHQQAADKEAAFVAKKKIKLAKPSAANDKGAICCSAL